MTSRFCTIPVRAKDGTTVEAIIDIAIYPIVAKYSWRLDKKGYVSRNSQEQRKNTMVTLHSVVIGKIEGKSIDHINRNKLDNRACNLRHATNRENSGNRAPLRGRRFKGVTFIAKSRRWQVMISDGKKYIYIGKFICETKAALAYDIAAKRFYGEFAYLNFPCDVRRTS